MLTQPQFLSITFVPWEEGETCNENRFLYLEVFDIIPAAIPRDADATDTLHSKINPFLRDF